MQRSFRIAVAGAAAGAVSGLFGAGGGMILVPLLGSFVKIPDEDRFPVSVAIMLPVCAVGAIIGFRDAEISFLTLLPYLLGGALGGAAAGLWGSRIPTCWLHRIFGALMLWGAIRYLC